MLFDRFKQVSLAMGMASALSCGGVTTTELLRENPNASVLVVPCRPAKIGDKPEIWALNSTTGHIVTDEQADELRAFASSADIVFVYADNASLANANEMASRYDLACPNDTIAQIAEAESLRNQKPCPPELAQTNGRSTQNLLAEPGKPNCNPPANAKKVQAEVRVCAPPPGSAAGLTRWASRDSKGHLLTNDDKVFADAVAKADILFILDKNAPAETIYWFVKDPSELKCEGKTPMPYKEATASGRLEMMASVAARSNAVNGTPKTGDGKTSDSSSPDGKGPPLSFFERLARNMSFAGALAQGDTSGNAKDPNGHRNGMVGGTNVGGWSFPLLQAGVSAVQIISAVGLKPKDLVKIISEATSKGQRVIIKEVDKEALKMVDELIASTSQAELAHGFQQVGTIMPYTMGQKVTANLESKFQAHKIFEKRAFEHFKMDGLDKAPCVILTDTEHKKISEALKKAWEANPKMSKAELHEVYKVVYANNLHWLEAIKAYF